MRVWHGNCNDLKLGLYIYILLFFLFFLFFFYICMSKMCTMAYLRNFIFPSHKLNMPAQGKHLITYSLDIGSFYIYRNPLCSIKVALSNFFHCKKKVSSHKNQLYFCKVYLKLQKQKCPRKQKIFNAPLKCPI